MQNFFVRNRQQIENNSSTSGEVASSSQETGSTSDYGNMLSDEIPVPAVSRGILPYKRDYINTRPVGSTWYDKIRSIRPLAIDWLRNSWGNVDEFGHHVYDAMKRIRHIFVPYDKLKNVAQDDMNGNGTRSSNNAYDIMERPPPVKLPSRSEIIVSSTTGNM